MKRLALTQAALRKRELPAAQRIPYSAMLDDAVIRTESGAYVMAFQLDGASFECADAGELNAWHERLHALWRNMASPHVALWTHLVRDRAVPAMTGGPSDDFAGRLARRYEQRLAQQELWTNRWIVSVVYRPTLDPASLLSARVLRSNKGEALQLEIADALDNCAKLRQLLLAGLDLYGPESLGVYSSNGRTCSTLLEFLGLLVNGERQPMPLPRASIAEVLTTTRLFFGQECIEYRMPTATRFGAMLAIKEYASPTVPGLFNALLTAPYPLILTQSFSFLTRASGAGLLTRQLNRLGNAGDHALSQAEGLRVALDQLASGEMLLGDHHFSLQILTHPLVPASREPIPQVLKHLNDHVADARSRLADTGILVAREDLALEGAFWAQLPGHFAMRPRVAPITSRNFTGMSPFHGYPSGRGAGRHWGGPVATLPSSAHSPYAFALHVGDIGHTFLCGPTGSGKTVLVAFLLALYHRQGATQVVFDKDRGLEILIRALGGRYLPLKNGLSTGFNPLSLPVTPANIEFLRNWLRVLARPAASVFGTSAVHELTVREEQDLDQALRGTMALDRSARRLSRLVEFLDRTNPEGLYARLARWCEAGTGEYAWVFDNEQDSVVPILEGSGPFGFDVTEFLDHSTLRTPITLYLFHLVRQLLDGRKLICWLDEFWRMLADPAFEQFAKDGPKTWRKLNGVMCLATQSASDVLQSPISHTIIEQTPTKIFFPNLAADVQEYREGFGLSARQFALIKSELSPGSRQFLIKQGSHCTVCSLNLSGMAEEIAVLSGRAESLRLMESLIAAHGAAPEQWLPTFLSAARGSADARASIPPTHDHVRSPP